MRSSSGGHANRSLACTRRMPVLGDPHLRGVEPLLLRVEHARVEAHAVERRLLDREVLARFDARRVGHERVDQEASARLQVRGDVGEAAQLRLLRVELEERVEHDEHERELAVDRRRRPCRRS